MRNNTPPSSPFFERNDMNLDDQELEDDGEDDELIYVGDGMGIFPLDFDRIECYLETLFDSGFINEF